MRWRSPGDGIRARVEKARTIQRGRFGSGKTSCNARMSTKLIRAH
jgi:predicted ATPase with chaperone activity